MNLALHRMAPLACVNLMRFFNEPWSLGVIGFPAGSFAFGWWPRETLAVAGRAAAR